MSNCHSEHSSHDHDHSHSHGGDEHDHTDDLTPALQYSLYQHIDFDQVTTHNERETGSGRGVVRKTWGERMSEVPVVVSENGRRVLVRVVFTGQVRLHAILLRTSTSPSAPRTLKLFTNRADLDLLSIRDMEPMQELHLPQSNGVQEIPVKRAKFSRVQDLSLYFEGNYSMAEGEVEDSEDSEGEGDGEGDGKTRIYYLGFKGDWMALGKAPEGILYEAAANPRDHRVRGVGEREVGRGLG
ncbi:hypothetical protein HYFRA_00006614 [Hymenoscyphus fraxineus]|uniref:PITH domain-containing protein n=1 Tax=Hymenoscyphus fraxineus TaxID=746836 RepID=A0A9N9KT46_9HELO|nr:hypothetical protein HYFRA_00006614 [Hymenoscyphus fraxineus]